MIQFSNIKKFSNDSKNLLEKQYQSPHDLKQEVSKMFITEVLKLEQETLRYRP